MIKSLPNQDRLKKLLSYNPITGKFTRKCSLSGGAKMGDIAGCIGVRGYIFIRIDGKRYSAHRLAWMYMTGEDPGLKGLDHRNGVPRDNRWANLRLANQSQNNWNAKIRSDNTTGFKGVSWHKKVKKYTARIMVNKKHLNLGVFDCPEKAYKAYCAAAETHHGAFKRLK